jgi:hypothetical protein
LQLFREKFYQQKGTDLSKNFQKNQLGQKFFNLPRPHPERDWRGNKNFPPFIPDSTLKKTQNDPQNHKNNQQHTEKHSPNSHTITNTHTKTTCKQQ